MERIDRAGHRLLHPVIRADNAVSYILAGGQFTARCRLERECAQCHAACCQRPRIRCLEPALWTFGHFRRLRHRGQRKGDRIRRPAQYPDGDSLDRGKPGRLDVDARFVPPRGQGFRSLDPDRFPVRRIEEQEPACHIAFIVDEERGHCGMRADPDRMDDQARADNVAVEGNVDARGVDADAPDPP